MRILYNISLLTESGFLEAYEQLMHCPIIFPFVVYYLADAENLIGS
jgi:hypothetical protein